MRIHTLKSFWVVGVSARTSEALEANPETAKIADLWGRLDDEGRMFRIVRRVNRIEYLTIHTDYDLDGSFTAVVGQRVAAVERIPDGLESFSFAPGKYLLFSASGENALDNTWGLVQRFFANNTDYQRAYATDIEVSDGSPDRAKIFVSIK